LITAAQIGISPAAFWEMTPQEFFWCLEGYARREKSDMRKRAWEVSHQVNLWAKDPVSPARLLGEEKRHTDFKSAEEMLAFMQQCGKMAEP
jgi:hypothetical protein